MTKTNYSTYEIRLRAVRAVNEGVSISNVAKAYQIHGQQSIGGSNVMKRMEAGKD